MNTFDFESDLYEAIKTEFANLGLKIGKEKSLRDLLLDYLTILGKLIIPLPREVKISPLLESKLDKHPKSKEVHLIAKRLKDGENVNFFQSRRLLQSNFHDHLLFEWNVYHFHLSTKLEPNGKYFKNTKSLLFTYIDEKQAILLDIDTHRDGVFADEKWLEILDDYFPEVLSPYISKDIVDVSPHLTPSERQEIWSKGISTGMTKVNGKIVHSRGIGRATSGHNVIIVKRVMETMRWINMTSTQFSKYGREICDGFGLDHSKAQFVVQFGDTTMEIIEQTTKKVLLSFPKIFHFETKND